MGCGAFNVKKAIDSIEMFNFRPNIRPKESL